MKNKLGKKSPLTAKPLRNPGESGDEEVSRLVDSVAIEYLLVVAVVFALALNEWFKYYRDTPPNPVLYSIATVLIAAYCSYRIYKIVAQAKKVRLGADGEKAVGQYLEHLREDGSQLFHDIPGEGFNIDHIVIDRRGIYVIETKTYSKPERGVSELGFDGNTITMFGKPLISNPIVQVNAAARWMSDFLKESTGKEWDIRPVVLFPGWYIKDTDLGNKGKTWVLNPKALPKWIAKSSAILKDDEVKMVSFHLSRFIRNR